MHGTFAFNIQNVLQRFTEAQANIIPENIGYGRRAFSGFAAYRYKHAAVRPAKPTPVFTSAERHNAVRAATQRLQQWSASQFEFEAECTTLLRAHFCLKGIDWEDAQEEASQIISAALEAIRAVRPTWAMGQREATALEDHCRWCSGPLPDEFLETTKDIRFCSIACATKALRFGGFEGRRNIDANARAATRMLREQRFADRVCEQCSKTYRPADRNTDQRYCSHACYSLSNRVRPMSTCLNCHGEFYKRYRQLKDLCSEKCRSEYKGIEQKCWGCRTPFHSTNVNKRFCTELCRARWSASKCDNRLTACNECKEVFAAFKKSDGFCSNLCRTKDHVRQALNSTFVCEAS